MKDLIFSVLLSLCMIQLGIGQTKSWEALKKHEHIFEFTLNKEQLRSNLETASFYGLNGENRLQGISISLPRPDGTDDVFEVHQITVMHPELAKKFPLIKTYIGTSKKHKGRQIRFSISHKQFAGYIMDPLSETIVISNIENDIYHSYYKSDYQRVGLQSKTWSCELDDHNISKPVSASQKSTPRGDTNLRTYRLALACTGEYASFHGGTVDDVMDAMVVAMSRVNGIYERDLGITMVLIPDNDELIFLNGSTDPYTNNSGGTMLGQNQSTIDNIIGTANYDIGHVFSTGGGGIASLDSPCNSNRKARGVTGLGSPIGDPFYVDYVAHEMGHQFGGNHTQNNDCQRNGSTAMEPGSASTIMGYAGICNPNVQNNSDDYFHAISLQEMTIYSNQGNGNTCAVIGDTGNSQVDVSVDANLYTLPVDTPFRLIAEGSDADEDDLLTYCWEQMDNEAASMPPSPANNVGPAFRSLDPMESPIRYFPNMQSILNNISPTWEVLPIVSRSMDFRCTVRDNSPLNGTIADADVSLVFTDQAGPFRVTTQNTVQDWVAFSKELVEWDVAGTDQAPVSCSQVDILMSLDGGFTYDVEVATGIENNGSAEITVPNVESDNARIMVVCSDNVFFDINNSRIMVRSTQFLLTPEPSLVSTCDAEEASVAINYSPVGNFNETITLSVDGLPENVSAEFDQDEVNSVGSVTLTFSGLENAAPGVYPIDLIGTGMTENYETFFNLEIYTSDIDEPVLATPENGAIGVDARPSIGWDIDGNVSMYTLELSTNPAFPMAETQVFNNYTSGSIIDQDLMPGVVYYWRVTGDNPCANEGSLSMTFSFQTGGEVCETFSALTNNLPILSTAPNQVRSLLSASPNVSISRMTATVDIEHDAVGDISIDLLSPSNGPKINLMNRPGVPESPIGCLNDDIQVTFDDDAILTADDLEMTCENELPTIGGTFQPVEPFAQFTGLGSVGIWILEVNDLREGAGGVLVDWSLDICSLKELEGELDLLNSGIVVSPNSETSISLMELSVSDVNPSEVVYTITQPTADGMLTLDDGMGNDTQMQLGDQFTQADIDNGYLNYTSLDGIVTQDAFTFDVVNSENIWSSANVFNISITSALSASAQIDQTISCFGSNDAVVTVLAVGGSTPYAYSIDGIEFQDSPTFSDLESGFYTFIVRDADDTLFETFLIELLEPLEINVNVDQAGFTITLSAENGIEPYLYSLDGINFQEDPSFMVPGQGDYVAYVQDANGCLVSSEFIVMASSVNDLNEKIAVNISPNPGNGLYEIMIDASQGSIINMRIYDALGKEILVEQLIAHDQFSRTLDLQAYANGTYIVYLEDSEGYAASYRLIKN